MGGAGQPGRPLDRAGADGAVRAGTVVAATGRPSAGPVPARGDLAADRHRHRPAVGPMRRADSGPGADRRRPARRRQHR
ncbi:hypothetical protein G6F59_017751 [Rhizopus arrhizus]|nr:hypothetical protein G6F59_017751 [Rhizopus arrhizus]